MALTGQVKTQIQFTPVTTFAGDTISQARSYTRTKTWTSGTGANAVDTHFEDNRTLADGANETLDLAGSLAGVFGTASFGRIKYLYIENTGTTTLTIGNASAPIQLGFGSAANTWAIPAGGKFEIENPTAGGWSLLNTTSDGLKVTNAAGAAGSYKIIIAGCST